MKQSIIITKIIIVIAFLSLPSKAIFSMSTIQKVELDYKKVLKHLRIMYVTIENFASDDQKKKYEDIKLLFRTASRDYYAQNFDIAYQKFIKVKKSLIDLMEEISTLYINRSKKILDSTGQMAFDIIIKYSKNASLGNYYRKPFDPIENIKAHDEKEYHFFYDREHIERYLNNGYKKLEIAKSLYNDPDLGYIKRKKKKTRKNLDHILDSYANVILSCRYAKMYGLEIYKLFNVNKLGDILRKYNLTAKRLVPIFDDRIPEEYKVDAIDNKKLIYSVEKKRLLRNLELN